jgi:hypothetical protein
MTEISDEQWILFEQTFNVAKTDVVNVRNHFRHKCQLFVHKDDLNAWNYKCEDWNGRTDVGFNYYEIMFKRDGNDKWILRNSDV